MNQRGNILIYVIVGVLVLLAGYLYLNQSKNTNPTSNQPAKNETISTPNPSPLSSEWKTYSNKSGFSVIYPPHWRIIPFDQVVDGNVSVGFSPDDDITRQGEEFNISMEKGQKVADRTKLYKNLKTIKKQETIKLSGFDGVKVSTLNSVGDAIEEVLFEYKDYLVSISMKTNYPLITSKMLSSFKFSK